MTTWLIPLLQLLFLLSMTYLVSLPTMGPVYVEWISSLSEFWEGLWRRVTSTPGAIGVSALVFAMMMYIALLVGKFTRRGDFLTEHVRELRIDHFYQQSSTWRRYYEKWQPIVLTIEQHLVSFPGFSVVLVIVSWLVNFVPSLPATEGTKTSTSLTTFIATLWPVHTALFSISAAVIIFMLQSVSARLKVSLVGQFSSLPYVRVVGGLGVLGVVSIGALNILPAVNLSVASLSVWINIAIFVSGVVSLALLYIHTFRYINDWELQGSRQDWIMKAVHRSIKRELETRLAFNVLDQECQAVNVRFSPGGSAVRPFEAVASAVDGTVSDIRMDHLRRLASVLRATSINGFSPLQIKAVLAVHIGRRVRQGEPLIFVHPKDLSHVVKSLIDSTIVISKDPDDYGADLRQGLAQLKDDAFSAIQNRNPGSFEQSMVGYQRVFEAVMEAFTSHGVIHGYGYSSIVEWMPLQLALSDTRDVLEKALLSEELAFLKPVKLFLHRVLKMALRANDHHVFSRLASFYPMFYQRATRLNDPVVRTQGSDAWEGLFELSRFSLERNLETQTSTAEDIDHAKGFLRDILRSVDNVGQAAVRRADAETISTICRYISTQFEHWSPDNDHPHNWELRRVVQEKGEDSPEAQELSQQLDRKNQLVLLKDEITRYSQALLFGLGTYAVVLHEKGKLSEQQLKAVVAPIMDLWPSLTQLSTVLEDCLDEDFVHSLSWDSWDEDEKWLLGRIITTDIKTESHLAIFYCLTGIRLIAKSTSPSQPVVGPHTYHFYQKLRDYALPVLVGGQRWKAFIAESTFDSYARAFLSFHTAALDAKRQQRNAALVETPLGNEQAAAFTESTLGTWKSGSITRQILRLVGAETIDEEPPEFSKGLSIQVTMDMPKEMLVQSADVTEVVSAGHALGEGIIGDEDRRLLECLRNTFDEMELPQGIDAVRTLELAIDDVKTASPGAVAVILVPPLALWFPASLLVTKSPLWKKAGEATLVEPVENYLGTFCEVPVFQSDGLRRHALLLAPGATSLTLLQSAQDQEPRSPFVEISTTSERTEQEDMRSGAEAVEAVQEEQIKVHVRAGWLINLNVATLLGRKVRLVDEEWNPDKLLHRSVSTIQAKQSL